MKIFFIIASCIVFFLAGCTSKQPDKITETLQQISYQDIQQVANNTELSKIEIDIDKTLKELQDTNLNPFTCKVYIDEKTEYLLQYGEGEYLSSTQELKRISQRAYPIVEKLFLLRLELRKQLINLEKTQKMSKECVSSFRKAFRYMRFLEEFITEIGVSSFQKRAKASTEDFATNAFQFYLNPKYKSFELKSGDILLMRPSNYVSAAISRIGDDDGQFSHGALVYIDENKNIFIIEALISKGLVLTPYEIWRQKNANARLVQYRFLDEIKAKELAHNYYKRRKDNFNNKSVLYDFHMDENSLDELFCTEVILQAFQSENIPTFKTSFLDFKNHDFLKKLTVYVDSAFAPSDIEIEPKFELVSEWRNYDTTNLARLHDAIITSVFRWMATENYKLKSSFSSALKTNIGYVGRHMLGLFSDKIPINMPYGFLQTLVELGSVNDILEEHMLKKNQEHITKYGYPMTYKKMLIELESIKNDEKLREIFSSF